MEIAERGGGLVMLDRITGPLAEPAPDTEQEYETHPVEPGPFVVRRPGSEPWVPVVFCTLDDGTPYIHHGGRAAPKAV